MDPSQKCHLVQEVIAANVLALQCSNVNFSDSKKVKVFLVDLALKRIIKNNLK